MDLGWRRKCDITYPPLREQTNCHEPVGMQITIGWFITQCYSALFRVDWYTFFLCPMNTIKIIDSSSLKITRYSPTLKLRNPTKLYCSGFPYKVGFRISFVSTALLILTFSDPPNFSMSDLTLVSYSIEYIPANSKMRREKYDQY